MLAIVNQERDKAGCRPVTLNTRLTEAAQQHSIDQARHRTMSHTGSDGSSPWERAERAGYRNAIGENVAYGYRTAQAVMTGWMNSPGHRANILNCDARAMGLGMAAATDGTRYWTQMFGSAP
ncbi:MAG TPA: CAP domain-containing protein [Micromonosporaceae bacterium]